MGIEASLFAVGSVGVFNTPLSIGTFQKEEGIRLHIPVFAEFFILFSVISKHLVPGVWGIASVHSAPCLDKPGKNALQGSSHFPISARTLCL